MFAIRFTTEELSVIIRGIQDNIKKGTVDREISDIHSIISGMKAWCTYLCYESVEIIRQSCGGAGFSLHSGLAHLVQDYAP